MRHTRCPGEGRLPDIARTACNINGDAIVVAGSEGELAGVEEVERRTVAGSSTRL